MASLDIEIFTLGRAISPRSTRKLSFAGLGLKSLLTQILSLFAQIKPLLTPAGKSQLSI
jgi:hypothetical protein